MQSDNEEWFGTRQVRARYNHVCTRTIDRWIINPNLGFPQPTLINGRRFWRIQELRRWESERLQSSLANRNRRGEKRAQKASNKDLIEGRAVG
jgi:hypothetical protein